MRTSSFHGTVPYPIFNIQNSLLLITLLCSTAFAQDNLLLLNNSPSLSQALDINRHGHIIGLKDVAVPQMGFQEQPFFWDGQRELAMPDLEGYTNTQPTALADNGVVAGYAARAFNDERGGMEACLWNTADDKVTALGRLPGHGSSQAFDISDDGSIVVGYSSGGDPQTMVPVVWQKQDDAWICERLTTIHDFNPYLLTSRVVVSGDGSNIAACITVRVVDRPVVKLYEASTFIWQRNESGQWQREKLSDHQLRMGDINDLRVLTGSALVGQARKAFVINADREFQLLDPLAGDENAGGTDINNDGTVVGYSDDPYGPKGGPTAFIWRGQEVSALAIPGDPYFSWANAINEAGDIAGYLTPRAEESTEEESDTEAPEQTVTFILRASGKQ